MVHTLCTSLSESLLKLTKQNIALSLSIVFASSVYAEGTRKPLSPIYLSSPDQIWVSYDLVESIEVAKDYLARHAGNLDFGIADVLVKLRGDNVLIRLGQFERVADLEQMISGAQKVSAYFEIELGTKKVKRFELCKVECGVFNVVWFGK